MKLIEQISIEVLTTPLVKAFDSADVLVDMLLEAGVPIDQSLHDEAIEVMLEIQLAWFSQRDRLRIRAWAWARDRHSLDWVSLHWTAPIPGPGMITIGSEVNYPGYCPFGLRREELWSTRLGTSVNRVPISFAKIPGDIDDLGLEVSHFAISRNGSMIGAGPLTAAVRLTPGMTPFFDVGAVSVRPGV